VIGHEIGHITGKHLANQLRQMSIIEGIATIAGVNRDRLVQVGVEYALRRPRSRQDELDADNRGLRMLTQSGYAPSAMPAFMQKLVTSASLPTFLSTHPAAPERVALLNQSIDPSRANVGAGLDGTAYKSRISSIP
ncbi:MAG: M48 family metalloprotease, partial [Synechococcales cyanobacterium]